MKKLIAAVTTAGLLIVGTAGVASAADSTSTAKAPASESAGRGLRQERLGAVKIAATTIGIEPKDLGQEIKAGKSVADVAKSHNVDPQKVIDAIVSAADKKLDEAVTAGKIDADRAATVKEKVPDRVTKLVNGELTGQRKSVAKAKLRRHARHSGVDIAASTIGIDKQALVDAVEGGQTIADVARSHNVDPQKVIDAVTTAANNKIDTAVTNGKLDAARAAKLKARLDPTDHEARERDPAQGCPRLLGPPPPQQRHDDARAYVRPGIVATGRSRRVVSPCGPRARACSVTSDPTLNAGAMKDQVALITGANAGIGKETAVGLAEMGATVVMTARDAGRGAEALADVRSRSGSTHVELLALDLADLTSVRTCADELLGRYEHLDVLVNNAGLVMAERTLTREGFETTFGVNHLGHFYLTTLLLDRLRASAPARVVWWSPRRRTRWPGAASTSTISRASGTTGASTRTASPSSRTSTSPASWLGAWPVPA